MIEILPIQDPKTIKFDYKLVSEMEMVESQQRLQLIIRNHNGIYDPLEEGIKTLEELGCDDLDSGAVLADMERVYRGSKLNLPTYRQLVKTGEKFLMRFSKEEEEPEKLGFFEFIMTMIDPELAKERFSTENSIKKLMKYHPCRFVGDSTGLGLKGDCYMTPNEILKYTFDAVETSRKDDMEKLASLAKS